jgi:hypothetical protein
MPLNRCGHQARTNQAARVLALTVFVFQLVRFYVVIPVGHDGCAAAHDESASAESAQHHHHQMSEQVEGDGNYFQHCKDGLSSEASVQGSGAVLQSWVETQYSSWFQTPATVESPTDFDLPPPFEPPEVRT